MWVCELYRDQNFPKIVRLRITPFSGTNGTLLDREAC